MCLDFLKLGLGGCNHHITITYGARGLYNLIEYPGNNGHVGLIQHRPFNVNVGHRALAPKLYSFHTLSASRQLFSLPGMPQCLAQFISY